MAYGRYSRGRTRASRARGRGSSGRRRIWFRNYYKSDVTGPGNVEVFTVDCTPEGDPGAQWTGLDRGARLGSTVLRIAGSFTASLTSLSATVAASTGFLGFTLAPEPENPNPRTEAQNWQWLGYHVMNPITSASTIFVGGTDPTALWMNWVFDIKVKRVYALPSETLKFCADLSQITSDRFDDWNLSTSTLILTS